MDLKDALRLDPMRLNYLRAMKARLAADRWVLTHSESDIVFHSGPPALADLETRNKVIQDRFERLLQTHDLISRLERELDDLTRQNLHGGPHLVRRSDGSRPEGSTSQSTTPQQASDGEPPKDSAPAAGSASPSSSDESEEDGFIDRLPQSREETLNHLNMSPDDPEADRIVAFHSQHALILNPQVVSPRFVSRYSASYQRYQDMFSPTGGNAAISDARAFHAWMRESSSRDRLRRMKEFIM